MHFKVALELYVGTHLLAVERLQISCLQGDHHDASHHKFAGGWGYKSNNNILIIIVKFYSTL
jgi:hypothetical protein